MIRAAVERWPIAGTFRIARGGRTEAEVVVVTVERGGVTGRGEAVPYARYGETVDAVLSRIDALPADVERDALQAQLGPGAARNAVDCALWDLEAKRSGRRAWELAGIAEPRPVATSFTLSLDSPHAMASRARVLPWRETLKVKVGSDGVRERLSAVHEAAPDRALIVDANESWDERLYEELAPELRALGVVLLEQPFPAGEDAALARLQRPVPVCADESCHTASDVGPLADRYDAVNVKLDKTGGLTEALAAVKAAGDAGLRIMIGCIVGTSLAIAPATLLTPLADYVDLDAPLLLARDRIPSLRYDGERVHPPSPDLWG